MSARLVTQGCGLESGRLRGTPSPDRRTDQAAPGHQPIPLGFQPPSSRRRSFPAPHGADAPPVAFGRERVSGLGACDERAVLLLEPATWKGRGRPREDRLSDAKSASMTVASGPPQLKEMPHPQTASIPMVSLSASVTDGVSLASSPGGSPPCRSGHEAEVPPASRKAHRAFSCSQEGWDAPSVTVPVARDGRIIQNLSTFA
jgi:hypothetical protein